MVIHNFIIIFFNKIIYTNHPRKPYNYLIIRLLFTNECEDYLITSSP